MDRAGSKYWLGKSSRYEPVDYPHGGGEGRAPNDHWQHKCKQKDFNMQQL